MEFQRIRKVDNFLYVTEISIYTGNNNDEIGDA